MALEPWIRIGQPIEYVMDDYERIFDAWEAGGIRGVVFGRLVFADDAGNFNVPAFETNPEPFARRGIELNEPLAEPIAAKEELLHRMLENAKSRGWQLHIFCPGQGTSRAQALPAEVDPYGVIVNAAIWEDVFEAFPEADGGIMDGWSEWPYEWSAVFREFTERDRQKIHAGDYDEEKLDAGRLHLLRRLQSLTPKMVGYYGAEGLLAEMNLFDIDENALYWLRWRRQSSLDEGRAFRRELDQLPRTLLLGNGLRTAAFSGITGVDFMAWDEILDLMLVKHYFWHRGYDGMYGTIWRWVDSFQHHNPTLSEQDCFTVVKAWFGVQLPDVNTLADMDLGFPQRFFDETVFEETRRALAAVSDPLKILPWVDTGRIPHRGDPMTAGDMHRILKASEEAGLQRFLFHNHTHLTAAEWKVISRMCGTEWDENPENYWPPNSPPPMAYR